MSAIALTVSMLALVAVLGLWIGNWKVYGVGLGIGGVLFGGIIVGHFAQTYELVLNGDMLHFIQEFGLILFVYTIGIQVGPGFFSSLRVSGLRLNCFAILMVIVGGLVTAIIHKLFAVPLPIILGVFSGAVTNTPALGAAQQILTDLGSPPQLVSQMGMGYAMAYPFGICGILLVMWLIRLFFKINVDREAKEFDSSHGQNRELLQTMNVAVRNPNLHGLSMQDVPLLNSDEVVCSRLKRGDLLMVPLSGTVIELGDYLHLVGQREALEKVRLVVGEEVDVTLSTASTVLQTARVVVTNEAVLGKKIRDLNLKQKYDVAITRLNRAGIELVASNNASLQFGDILNLVGRPESIEAVSAVVGNAQQKLQQVQMLPVFIGVGLGVLLGSIPLFIPGFPAALRLGLAGGPLVVALILGRIGSIGKLYWFMPPSANLALRELGIVLFLSVVGLKSGGDFINTLVNGDGLAWIGYGAMITGIPLLTVGILARMLAKMNYLTLCGMLAGSMTDPPALAFANGLHPTSGAAALSYATVYPLAMFLRIMSPQILAVLFWTL
ncbi:mediator of hyperadherence YidE [Yersinia enterocolitica]|uniref:Putative transport protein YE4162 n=2 Tax=Yersinia enterocolitica TaxID=630 RepID=Y4162_YERE8|nr:putative transporter [Yersinia enterocolitica]A1JT67.1 RecName: Full=Putative transport protein YE4162 [Yersinia enterocolitica subsp. enterocolitica 8081]AJI83838.1 AspT/YidE/YbjL antiporter duplication domain protein [Yersinia enterocolitica]AJJ23605.1 AspT/YidE/YbjL antiporter duplication domain protein [Yersinia enterocolitica]EKA25792.1 putative transporter [Yersinia enterocolitica subsp. enterocolitica WA-314]ELI8282075.1 putative transporter [Yersinia enterocolitica]KGA69257.1 AspT/